MTARTPADTIKLFNDRLNTGDLDGLVALYEPDAAFVPQSGQVVAGTAALRDTLAAFLALKPAITGETLQEVQANEVALVTNRWELRGAGPDGQPVSMAGVSADILRRQPDGSWRILIDSPWGGSPSA
ncbi:MAG: YybH family protein [Dehalococcoidia bacterium]